MLILEVGSKDRGGSAAAPLLHDPIISRSPKTDSGDYALIGVVGIAGVLILRRVIPRLGPSLDTSENPDVYVSPIKQVLEHEERSFAEFATAFRVGPTALRADNEDKEATREPKWFEDKS